MLTGEEEMQSPITLDEEASISRVVLTETTVQTSTSLAFISQEGTGGVNQGGKVPKGHQGADDGRGSHFGELVVLENKLGNVAHGRATHVLGEQGRTKEKTREPTVSGEQALGAFVGHARGRHSGATLSSLGEHNVRVMGQRSGQRKVLASGVLGSPLGKGKEREEEPLGATSMGETIGRAT
ncbi:unnamed protein product [Ilex paraguariensis]|uniref:Uncharacterized protein n=1 Tax=Ilex paraguariensis TaxID=185542 RepID=A0ABC8R116_9AQUA